MDFQNLPRPNQSTSTLDSMSRMQRLAVDDQEQARRREADEVARRWAIRVLVVLALVAAYATLAVFGVVPAAPWSPLGR